MASLRLCILGRPPPVAAHLGSRCWGGTFAPSRSIGALRDRRLAQGMTIRARGRPLGTGSAGPTSERSGQRLDPSFTGSPSRLSMWRDFCSMAHGHCAGQWSRTADLAYPCRTWARAIQPTRCPKAVGLEDLQIPWSGSKRSRRCTLKACWPQARLARILRVAGIGRRTGVWRTAGLPRAAVH